MLPERCLVEAALEMVEPPLIRAVIVSEAVLADAGRATQAAIIRVARTMFITRFTFVICITSCSENITLAYHHSDKAHKVPLEAATGFSPYASLVVGGKRLS